MKGMVNMDKDFQIDWKLTEWPNIRSKILQKFHSVDSSILFLPELETVFGGPLSEEPYYPILSDRLHMSNGWIGISHQAGGYFDKLIAKGLLKEHEDSCIGIVTLTEYTREEWARFFPSVRTTTIKHPFPKRRIKFRPRKLRGIRSLGRWKRKFDIWEALDSPYVKKSGIHENKLPQDKFDEQFQYNIQFMDVVDASANNGVLECIRRNTPLLINRHPAVMEYLGESYPFYFESLEEANEKINNPDLIPMTHKYLKRMDKSDLGFRHFEKKFRKTLKEWL